LLKEHTQGVESRLQSYCKKGKRRDVALLKKHG